MKNQMKQISSTITKLESRRVRLTTNQTLSQETAIVVPIFSKLEKKTATQRIVSAIKKLVLKILASWDRAGEMDREVRKRRSEMLARADFDFRRFL